MLVNYDITCAEAYLPTPRHKKHRYRKIETKLTLEIQDAEPQNFQKAYKIVTPLQNNRTKEYDIWIYKDKYYKNIKYAAANYDTQFFDFDKNTQQYNWSMKINKWNEYSPNNKENTLGYIAREKTIELSRFISFNNELYIQLEAGPTYYVENYNNSNYLDIYVQFKKQNIENYSNNVFFPDERCLLENYIRTILPRIHKSREVKLKIINTKLKTQIIPYPKDTLTKRPVVQKDPSYYIITDKPIYYRLNHKHLVKEELFYNSNTHQIESSGFILYNNSKNPKILFSAQTLDDIQEYLKKHNM